MKRLINLAIPAAVAVSAAMAPAALQAHPAAAFYTVELAQPASETEVIAGGVLFRCEGTTCTARRGSERPLRVCSELRREVGTVFSFSAGGSVLSESRLARCNG